MYLVKSNLFKNLFLQYRNIGIIIYDSIYFIIFQLLIISIFKDLLKFVREEVFSVSKRTQIQPTKAETPMEPYETYKIDFYLFEKMFIAISPLAQNNGTNSLAVRLFKVF